MLAAATVLGVFEFFPLPNGGGVTLLSMLPIFLIAYRYGTAWGMFTGFANGVLKLMVDSGRIGGFGLSLEGVVGSVFLDYFLAFALLGLAGLFRKVKNGTVGLAAGVAIACAARYAAHVLSGLIVFGGIAGGADGILYSLGYNWFMGPELVSSTIAAIFLSLLLDFRRENLRRT